MPKTMKNFHGLCEIGCMIGVTEEVDTLQGSCLVRLKVVVVDHHKISRWTKLTIPCLMVYRIFFELEMVVDEGWSKSEDELSQGYGYEDWMDFQHNEESGRDPKRAKTGNDEVLSSHICASTRTKMALEQRAADLKEHDEADLLLYQSKNCCCQKYWEESCV